MQALNLSDQENVNPIFQDQNQEFHHPYQPSTHSTAESAM